MALSTISPNASEQFNKLVNLAAVTNIIPYITAISAIMVIMTKARVSAAVYKRNVAVAILAIAYSTYALYASGMEAVMGGMLVLMLGYLIYGFFAKRFIGQADSRVMPMAKAK
jgi:putrescine:ornithine antiporter